MRLAPPRSHGICREIEFEVLIELDAHVHVIAWARGMVERTRAGIQTAIPEGGCEANQS